MWAGRKEGRTTPMERDEVPEADAVEQAQAVPGEDEERE